MTSTYDRARVFVAPTRFAAGIPHKVHEAASRGVPVVATTILASQLGWTDDIQMSVANDSTIFAQRCIELHEDREKWTRIRGTALDAIRNECSTEAFEKRLSDILAAALG
jgi:glycosyltransferase involved in cell wall biosynthesis